ncbi:MAG: DUF1343 domain-containing protein [Opitutales bacterium]
MSLKSIFKFESPAIRVLSILLLCGLLSPASRADVLPGIDVLEQTGFRAVEGKRVGLLTHPAGVNRRGESSIQILLRAPNTQLVALFGPEHGIYGDEKANVPIDDRIDPKTGLPVYSLYGKYRKPTPQMLRGLDALVIDLQDVGVRSYTYISCMRYAMKACFEQGVEVIILDRPNPLGGLKVDGPPLDRKWRSYVGAFHVPYVHGLTIAELARIAKHSPGWLETTDSIRKDGQLTVIPMRGWSRDMLWTDTSLPWIPTSPYIPDLSAVLGYAMTGLGAQEGGFSHGIGTPYPFRLLRHRGKTPREVKAALEARQIPGLAYRIIRTRTAAGTPVEGVYVSVQDWSALRPTELSFHMMQLTAEWTPGNPFATAKNPALFNKHVGSSDWWEEISTRGAQARIGPYIQAWARSAENFQSKVQRFWLYPESR